MGIALPGNGSIPAVHSGRMQLAKRAGMAIMELVKRDIKARDIINEKSIRNALACEMALGCSSNSVLHLLAIANEAGVELNLNLFNEMSAKVPNLCHLAPAGPTHMQDLFLAGGVAAVQSELVKGGHLDTSVITATGNALDSCCGIPLPALEAEAPDEDRAITVETVEDEHFVTVRHPMTKAHFISFIAFVTSDRIQLVKCYPEGNAETRMQLRGRGYLYYYCNRHGRFRIRR